MGETSALGGRSEDLRREIDSTRQRIELRADALRNRLSPGELLRPLTARLGETIGEGCSKFLETFRESPIPLGLVGIGLWWLIANDRRSGASGPRGGPRSGERSPSEAAEGVAGLRSEVSGEVAAASRKVRQAAHRITDAAATGARRTSDWVSETLDENPLLVALGTLVAGVAAGLALPSEHDGNGEAPARETAERLAEAGLTTDAPRGPEGEAPPAPSTSPQPPETGERSPGSEPGGPPGEPGGLDDSDLG